MGETEAYSSWGTASKKNNNSFMAEYLYNKAARAGNTAKKLPQDTRSCRKERYSQDFVSPKWV